MKQENAIRFKRVLGAAVLFGALVTSSWAADGAKDLSGMATTVISQFQTIGKLMTGTAYIAGFAMVISAIFKFKQHKDNPQQVPMGTPITILLVGIALIFMPTIIKPIGSSIFGDGGTVGGFTGDGIDSVGGAAS